LRRCLAGRETLCGLTLRSILRAARESGRAITGAAVSFFRHHDTARFGDGRAAHLRGTILARLIRHANMIGPIGFAIALIDIWGVLFGGIVSQMLSNKATQPLAEKAMAAGPKSARWRGAARIFRCKSPRLASATFFSSRFCSRSGQSGDELENLGALMWAFVSFALLSLVVFAVFSRICQDCSSSPPPSCCQTGNTSASRAKSNSHCFTPEFSCCF
jgi:hypothetical protein